MASETPEELEEKRVARAVALATQERDRAVAAAEERGRERAATQARLDEHERHLKGINGSIERLAAGIATLGERFERIEGERIKRDVEADTRTKIVQELAAKQITKTNLFITGAAAAAAVVTAVEFLPKLFGG